MKQFSITGWWCQPGYRALDIVDGRAGLVVFNNKCAFSGIIVVNEETCDIFEDGSILFDKNGGAAISLGKLDEKAGRISFHKLYFNRNDVIYYAASFDPQTNCWCGRFQGAAVGKGLTTFVLQELPAKLFNLELQAKSIQREN